MKSYEAIEKAVARKTVEHAKRLRKSTILVNKWMEPSTDFTDSGTLNPIDRIETIIETSLALGGTPEDAFAPIQYLAERFGLIVIPVPEATGQLEDVSQEMLKVCREFGHLTQETAKDLLDGKLSKKEAARIDKEAWELIRQVAAFIEEVNATAK